MVYEFEVVRNGVSKRTDDYLEAVAILEEAYENKENCDIYMLLKTRKIKVGSTYYDEKKGKFTIWYDVNPDPGVQ